MERTTERAEDDGTRDVLRMAHEELRTWRHCVRASCRRAHTCLGDLVACGEEYGERWTWLQRALGAVRAGEPPSAAMLAADIALRPKMKTIIFSWSNGETFKMKVPLGADGKPLRR